MAIKSKTAPKTKATDKTTKASAKATKRAAKQQKKGALELIRLRNFYYRDNYRRLVVILFLLGIVAAGLGGVIFYLVTHRPAPVYFATNIQGGLIDLQPLNRPSVSQAELLNWVQRAVASTFTMNYVQYRQQISDTLNTYFTPQGGQNFQDALSASNDLGALQAGKYIVTANATSAPIIEARGPYPNPPYRGRYAWQIAIPMQLTVQNESGKRNRYSCVRLLVVRSSPMVDTKAKNLDGVRGIGIGQFLAQQMTSPQQDCPARRA